MTRRKLASDPSRRPFVALAALLLALTLAGSLAAQEWKGRGRLHGKVTDPEGKPYKGARIVLRLDGVEGQGPDPVLTDKKGRWSYLGLTGGTWTVRIETDEYQISEGSVSVSEGQIGAGTPIQIQLKAPTAEQLAAQAADFIDLGNQLMQTERYAEAREQYEKALADTPEGNRPAVLRGIAQTHALEGDRDQAIATLERSLELDPDDSATLRLTAELLLEMGRKEEAEEYMARLPEGEAIDATTRLNLGIDLYNQGDLDGALEHFEKAVADYPDDPEGYYYRGLVQLGQEKNAEALADLRRFLEIAPADHPKRAEAEQFVEYLASL